MRFNSLPQQAKDGINKLLETRKQRYEHFVLQDKSELAPPLVILVGDRPGPSAPLQPDYHHTPFYSVKHCSGWLNELLWTWGTNEDQLLWLNAYDKDGNPSSSEILRKFPDAQIIALGGNAERWLAKSGVAKFYKSTHPQYHKRFKNKEQYMLPLLIQDCLPLEEEADQVTTA